MTLAITILKVIGVIVGPALLLLAGGLLAIGICRNSGDISREEDDEELRERWGP